MSKMRKKKMDFLSSETDDDDDVSDVDPEELQKMLEVCLVFILLKFNCLLTYVDILVFKFKHFWVTYHLPYLDHLSGLVIAWVPGTRRMLEDHVWHPRILRVFMLLAPSQSSLLCISWHLHFFSFLT